MTWGWRREGGEVVEGGHPSIARPGANCEDCRLNPRPGVLDVGVRCGPGDTDHWGPYWRWMRGTAGGREGEIGKISILKDK